MQVIGNQQSPVLIHTADSIPVDFGSPYLQFHYSKPLAGKFNGDNFDFNAPAHGEDETPWSINVGETRWIIRKIHIHAPAEHKIDSDASKPYECHLVHSAAHDPAGKGDKLVVGVFIVPHADAPGKVSIEGLNEKLKARRKKDGKADCKAVHDLHPGEFLPEESLREKWFRYEGSLTSWPFSEDVSWIIFKEDAQVRLAAFSNIAECAEQEERPVQPLNRRYVLRSFS